MFFFPPPKKTEFAAWPCYVVRSPLDQSLGFGVKIRKPDLAQQRYQSWKQVEREVMSTEREGRSLQVSGKGQKDKNKMGIEVKDRALGALEESTGIPKLL